MGTLMQVVDAFTWLPFLWRQPDLLTVQQRPSILNFKMADERTFIMIKPDGVQRGLVGEIIKRFEQKGFQLVAMKFMQADEELLKQHYADLSSKPFFPGLKYMGSGPVVPMVWQGAGVVKTGRVMLGETSPKDSKPGTIRGDYCIEVGRNICHGSDAVESAQKEISLWFKPEEPPNTCPADTHGSTSKSVSQFIYFLNVLCSHNARTFKGDLFLICCPPMRTFTIRC